MQKIKTTVGIFFLLIVCSQNLYSQQFKWLKNYNDTLLAPQISIDKWDNLYITGRINDSININGTYFKEDGVSGNILIKMDKERNYRWAKKIAKHSYKNNFIKNDDQGNVFVRNDAGIYKYDSSGNLLWSKEGRFTDICTDPVGNIYLSGSYYKYLMYDTDTLKVSNGTDGFVFKLNPNGGLLWTICTSLDTYHLGAAYSLALDTSNNLYMVFMMRGDSIDINTPFEKKTLYYAPSENNNLLILKVDNAGEAIWLKQGSGFATHALVSNDVSYIVGPLLSVSLAGDCYLDLPFQGNPNQDSVTLGNKTRVNPFPWLTFKFKGDGTIDTIFDLYPFAELSITRVVVDEFHNATYTGSIFPAQYDSFTKFIFLGDDSIQISKLRGSQILIYRMDKMGKILWYKLTGSRYGDAATDIAIDSKGNVFIAGYAGYNSMQKRPYDDIALFDDLELQVPKNGLNPHVFDVNFITYLESCSLSDPHTRLISKNTIYAGVGADYYQWYLNNKPISGATDSILEIKSSGNYSVHISLKGCLAQSIDSFYKFEKEVGIESFNNPLNYINVYPVPAQDQVNLKLFTSENLPLQLQLQDLQGRNIAESTYSLHVGENKWSLSLKDVKPGVYFLKLNAKDWQKTEKILIVK